MTEILHILNNELSLLSFSLHENTLYYTENFIHHLIYDKTKIWCTQWCNQIFTLVYFIYNYYSYTLFNFKYKSMR